MSSKQSTTICQCQLSSLQGVDPRSHLICTPPRRATPPGSPQFLYWGIWASPPETDQDSCPGWLPPVPLDLVSPQEGFSPGPLTPRFKRFPATRILPITFCVFSMWYKALSLYTKTLPIGRVYQFVVCLIWYLL